MYSQALEATEYEYQTLARLGELIKEIPGKKASSGRGTRSLPDGITKKLSHQAQQANENEEVAEQLIAEADGRRER